MPARLPRYAFLPVVLAAVVGRPAAGPAQGHEWRVYSHAEARPVAWRDVTIDGGLIGAARDRSLSIGLRTFLEQFEKNGYIENFRIDAAQAERKHAGWANCNEFVHKHLEAAAWYASRSEEAEAIYQDLSGVILSAQKPDGYLNTYFENALVKKRGGGRWRPKNRFEFYNFGHFTQAALARREVSGDRTLLDAAVRFADLIVERFADPADLPYDLYRGRVNLKYEHPNHELAMVALWRATGKREYLDFVRQTLEEYGYFGDKFREIWGHAVQETLLNAGAADLYLETGDEAVWRVVRRLWEDAHKRKMYITGGVGSVGNGEAFGEPFQLPNATAYSETCAAISLLMWNHKMLLATGEAGYADAMERSLYNNVLAGYSLDGDRYFYPNPLEWDPEAPKRGGRRSRWFGTACCPPNVHRLLASLNRYCFTTTTDGVQVNLFIPTTLNTTLAGGAELRLKVRTDYPFDGGLAVEVLAAPEEEFALSVRKPNWCDTPRLLLNGAPAEPHTARGYVTVNRRWSAGDVLSVDLGIAPRVTPGDPRVAAQRGKATLGYGPLVYCVEQADNPGVDLNNYVLPADATVSAQCRTDLLGGVTVLRVAGERDTPAVTAIPYYAWANRAPGVMKVWIDSAAAP